MLFPFCYIFSLGPVFDLVERHQAVRVLVVIKSDSALYKLCAGKLALKKKKDCKRKTVRPIKMVSISKQCLKMVKVNDGTLTFFRIHTTTTTNTRVSTLTPT